MSALAEKENQREDRQRTHSKSHIEEQAPDYLPEFHRLLLLATCEVARILHESWANFCKVAFRDWSFSEFPVDDNAVYQAIRE